MRYAVRDGEGQRRQRGGGGRRATAQAYHPSGGMAGAGGRQPGTGRCSLSGGWPPVMHAPGAHSVMLLPSLFSASSAGVSSGMTPRPTRARGRARSRTPPTSRPLRARWPAPLRAPAPCGARVRPRQRRRIMATVSAAAAAAAAMRARRIAARGRLGAWLARRRARTQHVWRAWRRLPAAAMRRRRRRTATHHGRRGVSAAPPRARTKRG